MTIRGFIEPETLEELFGEKPFSDDPDLEAELNCGLTHDGNCMNSDTEYCEIECPHRKKIRSEKRG